MPGPVERWLETFMCKQYAETFEAYGFKTLQSVSKSHVGNSKMAARFASGVRKLSIRICFSPSVSSLAGVPVTSTPAPDDGRPPRALREDPGKRVGAPSDPSW